MKDKLNIDSEHLVTQTLKDKMVRKTFKKGHVLHREGDVVHQIYFVRKGLLRSYSIDEKGKEHIFMFAPENWIMSSGKGEGEPTELFIDVLEDSEVDVINRKVFQASLLPTNNLNKQVKSLFKRLAVLEKRIIMLMSASAIERYEHFTETYPDIIQRVPQKMIASYLGITPEALSKVKGQKARRK